MVVPLHLYGGITVQRYSFEHLIGIVCSTDIGSVLTMSLEEEEKSRKVGNIREMRIDRSGSGNALTLSHKTLKRCIHTFSSSTTSVLKDLLTPSLLPFGNMARSEAHV